MVQAGFKTLILDKRNVGMGSTAASTNLLQYEIDVPLHQLIRLIGERKAYLSYLACKQAIFVLGELVKKLPGQCEFEQVPSFQFASSPRHSKLLQKEYDVRKKAGFKVSFLDRSDILKKYGFSAPAAILSREAAQTDGYLLTHLLLKDASKKGALVYDHTEVRSINYHKKGIELITTNNRIKCDHLVIACGYESESFLHKKIQKTSFDVCNYQ